MLDHIAYIDVNAAGRACEVPMACLHLRATVEDPEPKAKRLDALRKVVKCGRCRAVLIKLRELDLLAQRALDDLRSLAGGAR